MRASAELTRGSRLTLYGIKWWPNVMSAPAFIALVHFHSVWIGYGLLLIYAVVGYPWRVTSGMVAYRTLRERREEAPVWSAS